MVQLPEPGKSWILPGTLLIGATEQLNTAITSRKSPGQALNELTGQLKTRTTLPQGTVELLHEATGQLIQQSPH